MKLYKPVFLYKCSADDKASESSKIFFTLSVPLAYIKSHTCLMLRVFKGWDVIGDRGGDVIGGRDGA